MKRHNVSLSCTGVHPAVLRFIRHLGSIFHSFAHFIIYSVSPSTYIILTLVITVSVHIILFVGEAIVHNLLKETSRHFYYWPVMLPDRSNKAQDRELIRNILFDTRDLDISNILLLTEPKTTKKILQQAKQLGLVSNKNKWLIMNLVSTLEEVPE